MTDFETTDFFTDESIIPDPYPYFDHLRGQCPTTYEQRYNTLTVTGHREALSVYRDDAFSSCVSVAGPLAGLPFEPEGDDIGALIAKYRDQIPMSEHMVTMDPPDHTRARGLLKRLLTPKRLRENESFMHRFADAQIDEFISHSRCEFLEDFAKPFAMLVIADLLGVPEADHQEFRAEMGGQGVGALDDDGLPHNPLAWHDKKFTDIIADRRQNPRGDVLTLLAEAKYPDGSTPEIIDVVRLAALLFAAGSETTANLLGTCMRIVAEREDIQDALRQDRALVPAFIEEALRTESPVKSHFRLARKPTKVGDVSVRAGTILTLLPGASNRDPRKFKDPNEFRVDRQNVRSHLAFGSGVHKCPGAPLARAEARITVNRILDRTSSITLDEGAHGPAGARRYVYDPTFILRGLSELHIEFTPRRDQ